MRWLVKGYNDEDEVKEVEVEADTLAGAREAGEEVLERLRSISQMEGGVPGRGSTTEASAETEDTTDADVTVEAGVGAGVPTEEVAIPDDPA